jgi:hypothetical protein
MYWAAIVAATGMTAWFGSALVLWLIRQFSLYDHT